MTGSNQPDRTAYQALVTARADAAPCGLRHNGDVELGNDELHTVLVAHEGMAEEALSSPHFAADVVDEMNSIYGEATQDARLAEKVLQYLRGAAQTQVFEDVRQILWDREEAESDDLPDMPATEASFDLQSVFS